MTEGPDIAAWLADRTIGQLTTILDRRPDACWGAPLHSLDDLGSRLVQPASVAAAVARLPLPGVELLQAAAALGPRPTVADAAELLAKGDRNPDRQVTAVGSVVRMLEDGALAWSDGTDGIMLNPGLRVVIDEPLGLGRTVASHLENAPLAQLRQLLRNLGLPDRSRRSEASRALTDFLADQRRIRELILSAPAAVRTLLVALASARVDEYTYDFRARPEREGESWARSRGLLFGGQ